MSESAENRTLASQIAEKLAAVKFAVMVVIIIAIACVAGTLIPQGTDVTKFLAKNPAATAKMDFLGKLGLTHVFYSWWFVALLCTLSASVLVCSTRRFSTVRRTTGFARGRALGSMLTHISILLILTGGVIRGVWGEKGYLELREGGTYAEFVTEKGVNPLPFGIHLAKFEIVTDNDKQKSAEECAMDIAQAKQSDCCNALLVAWPEKSIKATLPIKVGVEQAFDEFKITIVKYIPDFVIDMSTKEITSRSSEPRNPAVLVAVAGPSYRNHRWLFAKFPDFVMHTKDGQPTGESPLELVYQNHGATQRKTAPNGPIRNYRSTLDFVEGDAAVVQAKTIEVNSPFKYKGYTFYQSGYNPNDLSYSSLQVVKDPGVPVVYAGFSLMIIGLFIVFYLNPWLQERRNKS